MARLRAWLSHNWTGLVLAGILAALVVADYFSAMNNAILRDRNRLFAEQKTRDELMIEQHRALMAVCKE